MEGDWSTAERGLTVLGVRDDDGLRVSVFSSFHARVLTLPECAGCPLSYQPAEVSGIPGGWAQCRRVICIAAGDRTNGH